MSADIGANVIASVALLVSIASAVYAWKSAAEAKVANQISVHEYQKQLYEAFVKLHNHLVDKRHELETISVSGFESYVRTANLYVDISLAREIVHFYGACLEVIELRNKAKTANSKMTALMDDLRFYEDDEADRHDNEMRLAKIEYKNFNSKLMAEVDTALNVGSKIDAELMRKLKLVRT